ncbi:MAG: hypothetical protein KDB27_35615 [Planctomycetales bacterium]|nr:hypothetical protein [Planctomycetales bacterium]
MTSNEPLNIPENFPDDLADGLPEELLMLMEKRNAERRDAEDRRQEADESDCRLELDIDRRQGLERRNSERRK